MPLADRISKDFHRAGISDSSEKNRVGFRYAEMRPADWSKKGHPGQRKQISPLKCLLFSPCLSWLGVLGQCSLNFNVQMNYSLVIHQVWVDRNLHF